MEALNRSKRRSRLAVSALLPLVLLASAGAAETLTEKDGVALTGTVRLAERGAATCRVREANHPGEQYERIKENDGQPLNLWELEFAVHNGSGKPLNHLIALYGIESPWPPCTYWDGAAGVDWVDPAGHIQRTAEPVSVAAGETVTEQITLVAFHTDTPKFARWSVDYTFAATSAAQGTEDRRPAPGEDSNPTADLSPQMGITAEESCVGKSKGAACWEPLAGRPNCHVWSDSYDPEWTRGWSGGCVGGVAHGEGTLTSHGPYEVKETGGIERGKRHGRWEAAYVSERHPAQRHEGQYADGQRQGSWAIRFDNGDVWEGEYLDGERHGHWVERDQDGNVREGPYVDGKRHGAWVLRFADGVVDEGLYKDGEIHGRWVGRFANGRKWDREYAQGTHHGLSVSSNAQGQILDQGHYVDGQKQGHWVENNRPDLGFRFEGPHVDGERHGHWIIRAPHGIVSEGSYVEGKRQGRWVEREDEDETGYGYVSSGPYVAGNRHGHWVTRYSSGETAEGPWVDGERTGHWVHRSADGTTWEGMVVDRKRHGRWVKRNADGEVIRVITH